MVTILLARRVTAVYALRRSHLFLFLASRLLFLCISFRDSCIIGHVTRNGSCLITTRGYSKVFRHAQTAYRVLYVDFGQTIFLSHIS
jgi:hypothetical protein